METAVLVGDCVETYKFLVDVCHSVVDNIYTTTPPQAIDCLYERGYIMPVIDYILLLFVVTHHHSQQTKSILRPLLRHCG